MKGRDHPARVAAESHSDLNIFHSIIAILEGGTLYRTQSKETAAKIIRLCKSEAGKRLHDYDRAMDRIE